MLIAIGRCACYVSARRARTFEKEGGDTRKAAREKMSQGFGIDCQILWAKYSWHSAYLHKMNDMDSFESWPGFVLP